MVDGNFNDAFFKETVEHYMQVQNDFNARLDGTIDELADKIVNNTMPDADFGILNSDRVTAEEDAEYMDAYFDGDEDLMQELVDKVANRLGYKYKAYHHTENGFTVFDLSKARASMDIQGFYFSADKDAESEYGSVRYDTYLKMNNPYIVDSKEKRLAIPFDMSKEDAGVIAREWLQSNGYDGVIRKAEYYGAEADEYIVFDSSQIKSAEPMTFADDEYGEGDVIPLSQRFNEENDDIRYMDRNGEVKKATELSEEDLKNLLEDVQNGVYSDSTYIPLRRNTPKFFIGVVKEHSKGTYFIEDYPMAATVKHLRQNMEEEDGQSYGKKRPHGFSVDDIVTISRKMGDPSYIVLQENGRYAEVVSFYNKKNKKVVVSIAAANNKAERNNNYKYSHQVNGYADGFYNIIVTQYEPDSLETYLQNNEVVYDKNKMNGKYQVGSGRIVTVTHDTPFIEDIIQQDATESQELFSVREEAAPKKTETVYKLMKLGSDNKLYPLFIDGGSPVELGVWYNADSPSFENLKDLPSGYHLVDLKTGETIVSRAKKPSKAEVQFADNNGRRWMFIKDAEEGSSSATRAAKQYGGNARFYYNVGINGSGSVSEFALRPGWHAGSLPVMEQIGNTSMRNIRADNFVWVEGEISYDIDYQKEAESNPSGENDIPFHIPKDGAYIKGTSNFVTKGMTWYIAGAFKANRIIGDREARKIVDNFNENIKDADAPMMS